MGRRIWQALVILGLSLSQVGCILDGCYELRRRRFGIDLPADAVLQFHIDRCRTDAETCVQLCSLVLARNDAGGEIKECTLAVDETRALLDVGYRVWIDGPWCDTGGDDVGVPSDF